MAKREKIAITVNDALLGQVERMRKKSDESRNALFERALVAYFGGLNRAVVSLHYREAYLRQPESATEVREAMTLAQLTFALFQAVCYFALAPRPWPPASRNPGRRAARIVP